MTIGGGSGGDTRVPIPESLRKTILNIKEIAAGKHSDDDIYAMLKDCNMDPNDTVQKLLYLDTFHEVKSKREKKIKNAGRIAEEHKYASSSRGARSSRIYDDSGRTRQISSTPKKTYYKPKENKSALAPVPPPLAPITPSSEPATPSPDSPPPLPTNNQEISTPKETVSQPETPPPSQPVSQLVSQPASQPHVIYPQGFKVPESFKKGLFFGSLEASGDYSSGETEDISVPKSDEVSKEEKIEEITGSGSHQYSSILQTQTPIVGPTNQEYTTFPPQHVFPYIRHHPYTPNFIPYNPYFPPHLYMPPPPHHHQFFPSKLPVGPAVYEELPPPHQNEELSVQANYFYGGYSPYLPGMYPVSQNIAGSTSGSGGSGESGIPQQGQQFSWNSKTLSRENI